MFSRAHRLAKGRPLVISEKAILASCRQLLRLHKGATHLDYIRVTVTGVPRGNGQFWSRNEDQAGMTDLIIIIKHGPTLWVELKASEGGRLSADQKAFRDRIQSMGHKWYECKSVDDLERILVANGVPPLTLLV